MKYFLIFRFLSSHIGDILAGLVLILLILLPTLALVGIVLLADRERSWTRPSSGSGGLKFVLFLVLLIPLLPPVMLFTVTFCVLALSGDFNLDGLLAWYGRSKRVTS